MRHETTRVVDEDELETKFPHLEKKKPEKDVNRLSGSKILS